MGLWSAALDWMFPPACPGCDTPHALRFCDACVSSIAAPDGAHCDRCGTPFASPIAGVHPCPACVQRQPAFRRARACAVYGGPGDGGPLNQVLHRFKYGRDLSMAPVLGQLLADRFPYRASDYDVVVPVPLHIRRLRWRGFNQALLLVRSLARRYDLAVDPFAVERTRATPPQVGLDAEARRRNVVRAFAVPDRGRIARRRVLLVDDVLTSGATTSECSRALYAAGAAAVDVLVLARAVG